MVNAKLLIALVLGGIIIVSTVVVFVSVQPPAGEQVRGELKPIDGYFPSASFTLSLAEGSKVTIRFESEAVIQGEERREEGVYEVTVKGFKWPEIDVDVEVVEGPVEAGQGVIVFTQLALPLEMIGLPEIPVPVYVPGVDAGICMELELVDAGGNVLTYEGAIEVTDYVVKVRARYQASSGIVESFEVFVVGPDARVRYYHEAVEVDSTGRAEVTAEWLCTGTGLSSDLRYVNEGLAVIVDGELRYITVEKFREGLQGDAVYLVISKACPYCQIDWSHMLKASEEVDVPFYAVIAGPLLGEDERKAALLEVNKAGVVGTPAFVAYKGGKIVDVRQGFMTWEEIVEWVREVYG